MYRCTRHWGGPPCLPDDVYTVAGIDRELRLEDVLVKQLVQLLVCVVDAKLSKRNSRRLWHTASCGIQRPVSRTSCVCRVCSAQPLPARMSSARSSRTRTDRAARCSASPPPLRPHMYNHGVHRRTHCCLTLLPDCTFADRPIDWAARLWLPSGVGTLSTHRGPRGCGCPRALVL